MQRNYNNDFERFLKENADQYRLYPSSKVWKGIHSALHSRRKWYGLGILLLLVTGTLITMLISNSPKKGALTAIPASTPVSQSSADANTNAPDNSSNTITGGSLEADQNSTASTGNSFRNNRQTYSPIYDNSIYITTENGEVGKRTNTGNAVVQNAIPVTATSNPSVDNGSSTNIFRNTILDPTSAAHKNHQRQLMLAAILENKKTLAAEINTQPDDHNFNAAPAVNYTDETTTQDTKNIVSKPFDWTIESVLNTVPSLAIKKPRRVAVEFNITPTISYRKLRENKSFLRSAAANGGTTYYPGLYNINHVVTHKPDMGLEMGLTVKYALASNFRVRAGLQFNVSRYDIKAFSHRIEVATIALNGGSRVDSFYTVSNLRNFNPGSKSNWLQNVYFQVSMPIGIEIKLAGDEKVQFGVASTIQPTYVIGDRAYLISSDYKNYARVPWLIRRWNVNTAFETFVSYNTGKVQWQVGPQVRYQILSSFRNKYPVKENLFDFGLKVGLSLTKQ